MIDLTDTDHDGREEFFYELYEIVKRHHKKFTGDHDADHDLIAEAKSEIVDFVLNHFLDDDE